MEMLSVASLYKRFGEKEVLCGLSLSVPEHSIFGFIGKNGSGKTTTMKAALGLLSADSGEIFVNGERVIYGDTPTNRYIGYLPDVPEFYSFMTAEEYLGFCGEMSGIGKREYSVRASELLELVGLSGEKHRIGGYSRGMKQRLGIAQALLGGPKLLICDEPTSALDPTGRKEILDIILSASKETTVLFSTHILSDVERICTDIALLNNGVAEISGKLADIRARYRTDKYIIEAESARVVELLKSRFGKIADVGRNQLEFSDSQHSVYDVMRFISEHRIAITRLEREEPTLESLFMEVTGK